MRTILYKCDECKKVLSDNGAGIPHLSIVFADYSGWVAGRGVEGWRHTKRVNGVKQFCNGQCLGRYFSKMNKDRKK